jgi:hypothetical protein
MEYIFLLNPYNETGLFILKQYSGSNKHFILPIAFDWDIEYVELFDKIDIIKTYLTIGIGSGARILDEHLNPIKNLNLIFVQNIPKNLNLTSYNSYRSNHFYYLRILEQLSKLLNTGITFIRPKRIHLERKIIFIDKKLFNKMWYLTNSTISYLKSIETITKIDIYKYSIEFNDIQFLDEDNEKIQLNKIDKFKSD